jgi:hypothetical protein
VSLTEGGHPMAGEKKQTNQTKTLTFKNKKNYG